MPVFEKLNLSDIALLRPYFGYAANRACDNTVGGTFMWRSFFYTRYAVFADTLILKVEYPGGITAFSVPLGADVFGAVEALREDCARENIPLVFCMATKEDIELLSERFKTEYTPQRNWADYLYSAQALITLSGRGYNGQRNHINSFRKSYPDFEFLPLGEGNLPQVRAFFSGLSERTAADTPVYAEELIKVKEVLDNYGAYGMQGGVLYAGGRVVGFSAGETARDTLFVHIEKADASVRGAYQTLVNEFARMYAGDGKAEYINREDDSGDEGLRASKLSYHPCAMVDKYNVTVKD